MQRNEIKFKLNNSNLIKFKNETKLFSAYPQRKVFSIYFDTIEKTTDWDVFILSGHGESENYNQLIDKSLGIQTTGWYIVKQHYYDKLINVFSESVNNMERLNNEGKDIEYETWAIDQNWKKLQRKDNWLKFKDNLGFQREDYSDIVKENVNYTDMLH